MIVSQTHRVFVNKEEEELDGLLSGWLKTAKEEVTDVKTFKALIGPHAGYSYSGAPQAWAYQYVQKKEG